MKWPVKGEFWQNAASGTDVRILHIIDMSEPEDVYTDDHVVFKDSTSGAVWVEPIDDFVDMYSSPDAPESSESNNLRYVRYNAWTGEYSVADSPSMADYWLDLQNPVDSNKKLAWFDKWGMRVLGPAD